MIFAGADFVNVREDMNSMMDEIDPGQPFLRANILRWREIFRVIETSSSNVDLIGAFERLIPTGEQSGLRTHIAATESVSSCHADELLIAFVELESVIRAAGRPEDCAAGKNKARQTIADHLKVSSTITSSDVSTYLRHG
jgi:hypothetical protein